MIVAASTSRFGTKAIWAAACGVFVFAGSLPGAAPAVFTPRENSGITHGPMLGHLRSDSVRVWARTRRPGEFRVRYSENADLSEARVSNATATSLAHDNAGWLELAGLKADTKYFYALECEGQLLDTRTEGRINSFRTLPDARLYQDAKLNPRGLFNFGFEVGSCNWQYPGNDQEFYGRPRDATYATMLRLLKDRIHFHIVNGDWIYEEAERPWGGSVGRELSANQWMKSQGVESRPPIVDLAEGITGVWQNYKLYLERGHHMAAFHREVPLIAMFDDHEIYNDIIGAGEIGMRVDARQPGLTGSPFDLANLPKGGNYYSKFRPFNKSHAGEVERSVFRDPALQAWKDYLGWANPDDVPYQPIHFGRGSLRASGNELVDASADFTRLDLAKSSTLHVHWGHGNTGVYEVVRVLDRNRLEVHPAAAVTEDVRYSIGTKHYTRFRVGNCEFYILDTRSSRTLHNAANPHAPGTTVLGKRQMEWLMKGMKASDADFHFVVSSVSFTIPHDNGEAQKEAAKDESWTAHAAERGRLLAFFESLNKPVFLLTGDIHNSFAVKITPKVWEFLSGPHMSNNHFISDMDNVPLGGPYVSRGLPVDIRWGTGFLSDAPKGQRPHYCVVQVKNAFNSPARDGQPRWVAYPVPHVIFQFYDGLTGELAYAESVAAK